MIINSFGSWNSDLHFNDEQMKRISASSSISIDTVKFIGEKCEIKGSSSIPYTVTLDSCSCKDFMQRKKPCKHIYFLAARLGYINNDSVEECKQLFPYTPIIRSAEKQSIIEAASVELDKLDDDAQKRLYFHLYEYIYHKKEQQIIDEENKKMYGNCEIVEILPMPFKEIVSHSSKSQIAELLKPLGKKLPSKITKNELPYWCEENAPELKDIIPRLFYLTFSEYYKPIHKKLYGILINKFRKPDYIG